MRGSAAFRAAVAPGGVLAGPWVKNELWRRARAVPSLDLRFADDKSLRDAVSGQQLITFTRASSGTFVGSDGVLRTATTNLLTHSQQFDNATSWTVRNATTGSLPVVTANDAVAPDGTLTADRIVFSLSGAGRSDIFHTASTPASQATGSIWLRSATGTNQTVYLRSQSATVVLTVTTQWQRFSATGASSDPFQFGLRDVFTGGVTSADIHAWGAQLEQSSTVGEYIPTTSTINSAPRFDHNPTTGESLGLLVEEQRTNLFLNSEAMASWGTVTRSTVSSNTTTAPDGTTTADTLIEDNTASNTHEILNTAGVAFVSGTTYTFTVFAKAKERSQVNLFLPGAAFGSGTAQETRFDLQAATATTVTGSPTAVITALANGWYRCSITAAATTTATGFPRFRLSVGGTTSYTGDNSSGLFLWGAQLEAGAFATSYIPTTTATVTRSADVASITGANFSSWYRQDEGSFYAENQLPPGNPPASTFPGVFSANNGTATNQMMMYWNSTTVGRWFVRESGTITADVSASAVTAGSSTRMAVRYASNDAAISANGGAIGSDTSVVLPTVDRLTIGAQAVTAPLNGTIRRLTYWPRRLGNEVLQEVTR